MNKKGKLNSNYKDGRTLKKYYCIDCKTELVNYTAKRCKHCYYKNRIKEKNYCIDCGKEISRNAKKCGSCAGKGRIAWNKSLSKRTDKRIAEMGKKVSIALTGKKLPKEVIQKIVKANTGKKRTKEFKREMSILNKGRKHTDEAKRKMSLSQKKLRPWRRGIKKSKEHKIKISQTLKGYKHSDETKRKMSLFQKNKTVSQKTKDKMKFTMKRLWSSIEYRERMIKKMRSGAGITPNKPEKFLMKLFNNILPGEYKYVGNGEIVIDSFCPDFINIKGRKKIVEHFGTYWHKNTKEKDKLRLETYKNYGYQTLVIWEDELKDIDKLTEKILKFNTCQQSIMKNKPE